MLACRSADLDEAEAEVGNGGPDLVVGGGVEPRLLQLPLLRRRRIVVRRKMREMIGDLRRELRGWRKRRWWPGGGIGGCRRSGHVVSCWRGRWRSSGVG
jgi:hypothetical protein